MYLTIDRGNTRTKAGVFNEVHELVAITAFTNPAAKELQEFADQHGIQHVIMTTSGSSTWQISDLVVPGIKIELSHTTPLPVKIIYSTPETLGRDRIAAVCGAHALYPGKNCLVVDAGTCITMNLLLASGIFIGGNIAPGITMRLKAMHDYTAKLPLAEPGFPTLAFGDSTMHALQNGACLGAVMEVEGILNRAREAYGEVLLVITGGDSDLLADGLISQIFVSPELVMHGLFQILVLNVD
jgi:type III pantothenate kinase